MRVAFKGFSICIFTALVLLLTASNMVQAAPAPVGYVDFLYLIDNHPDTPGANAVLKAEQEKAKQEFLSRAEGLSDREKADLDFQLGQKVEQKRLELFRAISAKVVAAANDVVKEKGLSIIISKKEVVCGGIDVTSDVLKKITAK